MRLMRLRFTGSDNATHQLLHHISSIDGVERVEEIADLMPQMDDPDSSSNGLAENEGPNPRTIEIEVPSDQARDVRMMAKRVASVTGAALEFELDEQRDPSDPAPAEGRRHGDTSNTVAEQRNKARH